MDTPTPDTPTPATAALPAPGSPADPTEGSADAPGRPTLLVFTRGASADRAHRPLLPGRRAAVELELRRGLLTVALEAGRRVGCRLRVSSPAAPATLPAADVHLLPQEGRDFGQRLEGACQRAWESRAWESRAWESWTGEGRARESGAEPSHGPLLVVGADVPGLTDRHLRAALDTLAADPEAVVLGPSPDGGFYLLASTRPLPGLAGLTRWCRSDTLAVLRRSLVAAGRRVVLLEPLADLDRRGDLERWLAGGVESCARAAAGGAVLGRSLLRRLAELLAELRRPLAPPASRVLRPAPIPVRSPRAPPRRR